MFTVLQPLMVSYTVTSGQTAQYYLVLKSLRILFNRDKQNFKFKAALLQ